MTAIQFRRLAILAMSVALISCLGGGGAGDDTGGGGNVGGVCDSITGGNAKVSTGQSDGCLGCSAGEHPEQAADGDLNTFAAITAPVTFAGQGVSIRATAQPGMIYPSGQQAAVFFIPPTTSGIGMPEDSVTIATYLANELQENPTSLISRTPEQTQSAYNVKMFATTKPFDAVEIMVSNTQGATMPFEIHEICSNTTLQ